MTGQNSSGEDIITWTEVGTGFWCNIAPLQGRELSDALQRWAEARYSITLRHQPGITFTRKMRITWGSRTIDILDVQDVAESLRPEVVFFTRDFDG